MCEDNEWDEQKQNKEKRDSQKSLPRTSCAFYSDFDQSKDGTTSARIVGSTIKSCITTIDSCYVNRPTSSICQPPVILFMADYCYSSTCQDSCFVSLSPPSFLWMMSFGLRSAFDLLWLCAFACVRVCAMYGTPRAHLRFTNTTTKKTTVNAAIH